MKIKLPTDWSQITLKEFCMIHKIKSMGLDSIEQIIEIASVVSGISVEEVNKLEIKQLNRLTKTVQFIFSEKVPDYKLEEAFELNNVVYKGTMDISKITGGQYIGLKDYTSDPSEIIYNIHNIMAIFYRPMNQKKYDGAMHNEIAAEFYEHMTVDKAYATAVFFCKVFNGSIPVIKDYLLKQANMKMKMAVESLKENQMPIHSTNTGVGLQL